MTKNAQPPFQHSSPDQRRLPGRRLGRPLRAGRKALLEQLLPRLSVTLPADPADALDLTALFGQAPQRLWLEIGFGGGEHLAWQAAANRDVCFLGAEHFINGIAGFLRYADQENLENVRLFQGDGRLLLEALPAQSLERVFLLFPDPWPKTRHHKRRFVQDDSLDRLATVLKAGGELRIATDHSGYLTWILAQVTRHPAFAWQAKTAGDWRRRPADWPATRYEEKALAEGRIPAYLSFLRRPHAGTPGRSP